MTAPTLLVVAKAPVAGEAKTRIAATIGDEPAADLAAAALLDTLLTATAVGWPVVVAMTGDLARAQRADEIGRALEATTVVEQRGETFGERLAHAHVDANASAGVVQIGMDTPHLTVADHLDAGAAVRAGSRVIGPAEDGGWWVLGLPDPTEASALADVEMSTADTGALTETALGGDLVRLRTVRDMDTWEDAIEIARLAPLSLLAQAVDGVHHEVVS